MLSLWDKTRVEGFTYDDGSIVFGFTYDWAYFLQVLVGARDARSICAWVRRDGHPHHSAQTLAYG